MSNGCLAQYEAFAGSSRALNEKTNGTPSRCGHGQARDVAGHVVGLAEDTAAGVPGSRNSEEEAASVRHESPAGAPARLRAATATPQSLDRRDRRRRVERASGVPDLTLGEGVLTLWYDTYVHADDIRAAVGDASPNGVTASTRRSRYLAGQLTAKGWGPPRSCSTVRAGTTSAAAAAEITGDALQFALVGTGRVEAECMGLEPDVNIYLDA